MRKEEDSVNSRRCSSFGYTEERGMMHIKDVIKNVLRKFGCEVKRYPPPELDRRIKLLSHSRTNLILDVGANEGLYASPLLKLKFKGKIVSFEPRQKAYKLLCARSAKYENWEAENFAIGNHDGETEINISENLYSSSILEMLPNHLNNAPYSRYVGKEKVNIFKLDSIFYRYFQNGDNVFLKIDTQGYEKNILEGAKDSLNNIKGIQLEMSLIPLYNDQMLFLEMISYLKERGFEIYSLEPGFTSPITGQLLQVDGIFFKALN